MVRILQDRTNGGRVILNQDGVWVRVLIEDLLCLLTLNYLFSPRWSYRMCPNWQMIPFFIILFGLQFRRTFLVIVPSLRESLEKTPKLTSWHTIYGVLPILGWMTLFNSVFSSALSPEQLLSGTSNYLVAFFNISTLSLWHSLPIFSFRFIMKSGRIS